MKTIQTIALVSGLFSLSAGLGYAATAAENWENSCAKCHAPDGTGSTKIGKKLKLKDYTDAKVQAALKDEDMVKAINDGVTDAGKEKMKGFKGELSAPEVQDLVAFIRKMKK
ncbi:MAG TPA: cytochrome c [Opitutaceae bacterium]|nr:cytochrome c [Opitutaceae bacterium]